MGRDNDVHRHHRKCYTLFDQVAFVSQEQFLFNTSLYENILMGKPVAAREEVLDAAQRAQCNEFLDRFPEGIETQAGDGGKQLSGGERQRISLARAILKDAPIIVLDEATAFMDPENEEKMNAALDEIVKDKTVLVIAHRLSTMKRTGKAGKSSQRDWETRFSSWETISLLRIPKDYPRALRWEQAMQS